MKETHIGIISKAGVYVEMKPWQYTNGIYVIRNLVNGVCYVGSCNKGTGGIRVRLKEHAYALNHNRKHSQEFILDWSKEHEFEVNLIEEYTTGVVPITKLEEKHLNRLRTDGVMLYNVQKPNANRISFTTNEEAAQLKARILSRCTGTDDPSPDACWLWIGCTRKDGYGVITWKGKQWLAHRLLYQIEHPEIDIAEYSVRHGDSCPKNCGRPSHMRIGNNQQNQNDSAVQHNYRGRKYTAYELAQLEECHDDVTSKMIAARIVQHGYDVQRAITQAPWRNTGKPNLSPKQQELLIQLREENPEWTYTQIANQVGCSRQSVSKRVRHLKRNNGHT
jgi:hypothetical protein